MKNPIFFVLTVVLLFSSCRKLKEKELQDGVKETEASCSNGVMDAGEDGIDCGANCAPCVMSFANCSYTLNDNQTIVGGTTVNYTASSVTQDASSGNLIITGISGTKSIIVRFTSATPEVFTSYDLVEYNPEPNEAVLTFMNGNVTYTAYSGSVHLNRLNGHYTFEFCDVLMSSSQGGYAYGRGKCLSSN